MMQSKNRAIWVVCLTVGLLMVLGGCAGQVQKRSAEPTYYPTRAEYMLSMLPAPIRPMKTAIILEDMSGQYRRQEDVASFSTAVSQAISEMGVRAALKSPQWFTVFERKGINYLSMERKIIEAAAPAGGAPLAAVDYLILGGVSQFDHNIVTGGAGFRLLGIGANTQYAIDTVVVDIRAIDPVNGRIIKAVSAAKRIFSFEVRANVYRYIDDDTLLEGEVGGTDSEPSQLCVREAVEKGIFMLAAEMGLSGDWPFKETESALAHPVMAAYLAEKLRNADMANAENSYRTRRLIKEVRAAQAPPQQP